MEDNSKLRESLDYSWELRDFTKTEHNVHFPYFGWKSCWLMATLPAGEWLFKIILEARKRKSSNNGLMSDEPEIEHNSTLKVNTDYIQRSYCVFLWESDTHNGHPTAMLGLS